MRDKNRQIADQAQTEFAAMIEQGRPLLMEEKLDGDLGLHSSSHRVQRLPESRLATVDEVGRPLCPGPQLVVFLERGVGDVVLEPRR